ncbi:MAG TPA: DNA polymerase III subunit gamma and tau [Jatrophihabitantaceae bacterium]
MAGNLALYRKYRSATFAEVIGQEHVTRPLSQALAAGRINHAYLFSGPRGCGKTSSARILARSLNCEKGPTPTPCGVCDSCLELAPNGTGSIDVIEIDAASHGGVDDARELRERAFYAPVRDRYKVYIVDEAHMVSTQGFNALLKLVEEPPEFLVFIFATTEPDKVLQTIRSRTHHYPFRLIPPGVMRQHLERICTDEGVTVEPAVLPLVVRAGGGSARDSLSVLDQLLAGAGDGGVTYADAVGLLGVTDVTLLDDMIDALAAADAASVYATVDGVVEAGHDPRRFAADLLDRFRDLIVVDAVPDAATRGLIDGSQDELARMADQSARLGAATLARNAEIVHTALIEMRGTTSPRLVLELLCARMLLPDAAADSAALLQRIERLERRNAAIAGAPEPAPTEPAPTKLAPTKPAPTKPAAAAPAKAAPPEPVPTKTAPTKTAPTKTAPAKAAPSEPEPTPPPAPALTPEPTAEVAPEPAAAASEQPAPTAEPELRPEPAAPTGEIDAAALRRLWPDVLDIVKQSSRRTRALLDNAQVSSVDGDRLVLGAPNATLAKMIGEDGNTELLRTALTSIVGGNWRVDVEVAGGTIPVPATPSAPATPQPPPAAEPDPREESEPDDSPEAQRVDPEAEALRLLQSTLGARPLADD